MFLNTKKYSGLYFCYECERNTFSEGYGSSSCKDCATGYATGGEGYSACDYTQFGYSFYFVFTPYASYIWLFECPKGARCEGNLELPRPKADYWVDKTNSAYAFKIYPCTRSTCKSKFLTSNNTYFYYSPLPDSACWNYEQYNNTIQGQGFRKLSDNYDFSTCDYSDDNLLCTKGAGGPLCGSCFDGYVYSRSTDQCEECISVGNNISLIIFVILIALLLITLLYIEFGKDFLQLRKYSVIQFLIHLESGSLKVLIIYCCCHSCCSTSSVLYFVLLSPICYSFMFKK